MRFPPTRLLCLAVLTSTLPLLAGCPPRGTTPQPARTGQKPGQAQAVEFRKKGIGLPSQTLAFVGKADYGIAGATEAGQVFYAVQGKDGHEVHVSDLRSGESRRITQMNGMLTNTLVCDPQGQRLVYTRTRTIDSYVDDPRIIEPPLVAVIQSYDVESGEESAVFDFKEGDWLRYRGASLRPQLSHSGQRVAALSYDIDRDNLMRDLDEWQALAGEYFSGNLSEAERHQREERMREILALPHVSAPLREAGTEIDAETELTAAHSQAVRALRQGHTAPQWAVLIRDGSDEPRLVQLKLPAQYALNPVSLIAVGDDVVLLATQGKSTTGFPEAQLLRVDEATGEAQQFATYVGAPSSIVLSADEQELYITYLPYDMDSRSLSNQLHLRTVLLDDPAAAEEAVLYPAVPHAFDAADDPNTFALHSAVDNALYVARAGQAPEKIAELLAPVDGLFITNDAAHVVYAENGILFSIETVAEPEQSGNWVAAQHFAEHEEAVTGFLAKLGYQIPEGTSFRFEEREGLGLHEVSALAVDSEGRFEDGVLLRYNVEKERVESLFFPGNPWPNSNLSEESIDAPQAESRAEEMRMAAGWLSDEAERYQPGANPLYDGDSATYVIVYRDGYLLDTPRGPRTAVNGESSIRVHKPTGQVVEMTLQTMPEVQRANFKASEEEIRLAVRNKGQQKYPESAPIRIDVANAGLIVARDKETHWQPARIELPTDWRLAWAVDTFIQPENELVFTTWVDVEDTDVLGELYFLPSSTTEGGL